MIAVVLAHEAGLGATLLVIPPILAIVGLLALARKRAERNWRAAEDRQTEET